MLIVFISSETDRYLKVNTRATLGWKVDNKNTGSPLYLRYFIFCLIQIISFFAVIFTSGALWWIPLFIIVSIITVLIKAAMKKEEGIHVKGTAVNIALWSLLCAAGWFVVFLLCGNVTGLYGWVFAGILFSIPLGCASAGALFSLSLLPVSKN